MKVSAFQGWMGVSGNVWAVPVVGGGGDVGGTAVVGMRVGALVAVAGGSGVFVAVGVSVCAGLGLGVLVTVGDGSGVSVGKGVAVLVGRGVFVGITVSVTVGVADGGDVVD